MRPRGLTLLLLCGAGRTGGGLVIVEPLPRGHQSGLTSPTRRSCCTSPHPSPTVSRAPPHISCPPVHTSDLASAQHAKPSTSCQTPSSDGDDASSCPDRTIRQVVPRRAGAIFACDGDDPDADLVSAWLDDSEASPGDDIVEISAREASDTAGATLLDLRTLEQHSVARPSGAVSFPAGLPGSLGLLFRFSESFVDDIGGRFPAATPLLLICDVGIVSRIAAARLAEAGYSSVRIVSGGFEAWSLEGLPTEGEGPPEEAEEGEAEEEAEEDEFDGEGEVEEWTQEMLEPWPTYADGTPCPIQPRPLGILRYDEPEDAAEDDDEFGFGEVEEEDFEADVERAAAEQAGGASKAARATSAPPAPDMNALAGDELDADLASLVAELDAPIRPPGGSALPLALAQKNGASAAKRPAAKGPKKRKSRVGPLPPAWLVDVSGVDFHERAKQGTLSKLSVKELKSYLYHQGEILSGSKKELVERVSESASGEGGDAGAGGGGSAAGPSAPSGHGGGGGVAAPPHLNGVSAAGEDSDEEDLTDLASLPPPSASEDATLGLFGGGITAAQAGDDFLIDEVFSAS